MEEISEITSHNNNNNNNSPPPPPPTSYSFEVNLTPNNENSSRKRGRQIRVVDSDDDSDFSDGSRTPNSTTTPKSQGSYPPPDDTIMLTPPKRRKSIVMSATEEKTKIIPLTPMNNSNNKKILIWKRYFGDSTLLDHPCPCCCQTIDIKKLNFEIQTIVPIESSDDPNYFKDNWNYLPLCSRDESEGWGCSEQLERCRMEREMDSSLQSENNVNQSIFLHGIDWIIENYPKKLQEIFTRLQIAYGDHFGLSAGETLCLRFIRDVYGTGKGLKYFENTQLLSSNSTLTSSLGNWIENGVGYTTDILDIADCFSNHTDREMMNIIEMKKKLSTPLSNRKLHQLNSSQTPNSLMKRAITAASSTSCTTTPLLSHSLTYSEGDLINKSSVQRLKMSERITTLQGLEENTPIRSNLNPISNNNNHNQNNLISLSLPSTPIHN